MRAASGERRGWDLNPRSREGHTISNRADSAALAPLLVTAGHYAIVLPLDLASGAAVGSCARVHREPSQGLTAAALNGSQPVPQIA
jgi:hypothetical protein